LKRLRFLSRQTRVSNCWNWQCGDCWIYLQQWLFGFRFVLQAQSCARLFGKCAIL